MAATFGLVDQGFIQQLKAENTPGSWWADVLADPELVVGLRANYLNVYWRGQSLFRVEKGRTAPKVTTHEKYLMDPALRGQVSLANGAYEIGALIDRGFIRRYEGPNTLKKLKTTASLFSGTEKTGCHEIFCSQSQHHRCGDRVPRHGVAG